MHSKHIKSALEKHFKAIDKIILSRQDAITGLLPASTAVNAHGDYTDAWVRDNVYSVMSVWGLALSYKKHYPNHYRSYLLIHSVTKLMRGLLTAMMKQSDKVETFKHTLNPADSLHAKYGTKTGLGVVGDHEWGHLQLDATSLFLLMIAQMSASGLELIYTMDEVNFIQNLVHYISRAYCTPDYGIWERGHKINHGATEINASSVGMAKAALEALDGFNLFTNVESQEGVIHVVSSDIARADVTLKGLLPRESNSKETDGALLSVIGYPAYAIKDLQTVECTREKIIHKLAGVYGCKRFLLDGHQSSIEDDTKLHYEPSELREFKDIESEWPLFFTYLLLDALMRKNEQDVKIWREKLAPLFVLEDDLELLPELFIVPKELIEAEKENPGSQTRVANENLPLVWAQSLYMLSDMILDGILKTSDIDPLNRRKSLGHEPNVQPMVLILAQDEYAQRQLSELGIDSETIEQVRPVKIMQASELAQIHTHIGKNEKLHLTGRPLLVTRTISTSSLYMINGEKTLFMPYYFNPHGFYFSYDNKLLVEQFNASLRFLKKHWNKQDRPIMLFLVRQDMLLEKDKSLILELLKSVESGKLNELIEETHVEVINDVNYSFHEELKEDSNDSPSSHSHDWAKLRREADAQKKYSERLEDALLDIVIFQKRLAVGRAYSEKATFSKPHDNNYIVKTIAEFCGNNSAENVLTQEIILHLGHLIRMQPKLFTSMLTIRPWYFVQLLVGRISREKKLSIGDAYEILLSFAPSDIYNNLRDILESLSTEVTKLTELENLHTSGLTNIGDIKIQLLIHENKEVDDWSIYREEVGLVNRLSPSFYKGVWHLLQQCKGLIIGDKYDATCRIGSEITLESTAGERSFDLIVDNLLQNIYSSSYRQLNIEAIESLNRIFKQNPDLHIENDLILDVLIGYAVRVAWTKGEEVQNYDEQKGFAWESFYTLSQHETDKAFIKAFIYLLQPEKVQTEEKI